MLGTLLLVCPRSVAADSRVELLARMLETSSQFRVRTQAALALGSMAPEARAIRALSAGLKDDHPAVRAASAGALELLKDASALPALRNARSDRDAVVRNAVNHAIATIERASAAEQRAQQVDSRGGRAQFYVAVGTPSSSVALASAALRNVREHVVKQVGALDGVRIAPEHEAASAADKIVKGQKLTGYYLDSAITKLEERQGGLRAQVSIIVGTYPGRAMRVMLSGAATVSGAGTSEAVKQQAVEAAFTGALRRLPQALQAGTAAGP